MEPDNATRLMQQFNETITIWIDALDGYTLEQLHQLPNPHSWSLGQVYRHIIDDTIWFVEQIHAALQSNEHHDKDMHDDAKMMFRNNSFPDIQIDGPATNTFIPQPKSKEELQLRLQTIKDEVNQFVFTHLHGKTQHPGLLFFNALEWLQFAEMHLRHHFRQKQRIDLIIFRR
jgi:hypothetical protein